MLAGVQRHGAVVRVKRRRSGDDDRVDVRLAELGELRVGRDVVLLGERREALGVCRAEGAEAGVGVGVDETNEGGSTVEAGDTDAEHESLSLGPQL